MSSRAADGRKQVSTTKTCRSPMITVVLPLGSCWISYTPSASLVTVRSARACCGRAAASKAKSAGTHLRHVVLFTGIFVSSNQTTPSPQLTMPGEHPFHQGGLGVGPLPHVVPDSGIFGI